MKFAAAQISTDPGELDANMRKIREFSSRAKESGTDLIVFPEMADIGYSMPMIQKHARSWNNGAVPKLQKIANELSIAIICGVSERDGASIYNAQVLIDRNGEVMAKYRKTHLVTAPLLDERVCFSPGNEFVSYKLGELSLGLSICYDLRFPEMCRTLVVQRGVNTVVTSSAWPVIRAEHLQILAPARAIENQSYLILANRVGTDDGVDFCGSSMIIDPYGVVLAVASRDREELLQAEISIDVINSVRNQIAVFHHRRTDLYSSRGNISPQRGENA